MLILMGFDIMGLAGTLDGGSDPTMGGVASSVKSAARKTANVPSNEHRSFQSSFPQFSNVSGESPILVNIAKSVHRVNAQQIHAIHQIVKMSVFAFIVLHAAFPFTIRFANALLNALTLIRREPDPPQKTKKAKSSNTPPIAITCLVREKEAKKRGRRTKDWKRSAGKPIQPQASRFSFFEQRNQCILLRPPWRLLGNP
ncbi:hypothetical protein BU16DRAFT_3979 [Lophium mytilinum]|uniref:Uncharacterized protein n=1 Tax=Lophium mytilinum TaxID=390894 RepID=A0A6A6REV8_9PEZI|nr:hypothetical protein BU16DRAFT_3979 [Lophium mytilinum]